MSLASILAAQQRLFDVQNGRSLSILPSQEEVARIKPLSSSTLPLLKQGFECKPKSKNLALKWMPSFEEQYVSEKPSFTFNNSIVQTQHGTSQHTCEKDLTLTRLKKCEMDAILEEDDMDLISLGAESDDDDAESQNKLDDYEYRRLEKQREKELSEEKRRQQVIADWQKQYVGDLLSVLTPQNQPILEQRGRDIEPIMITVGNTRYYI